MVGGFYLLHGNNNTAPVNNAQPTSEQPTAAPTSPSETAPSSATVQKITVEGSEFAFSPATITLKKGQRAEITFKNTGTFPHNLTVSGINLATKTVQPGEQDIIQLTPDKAGQFSFTCTVDSHAARGMKGMLVVE